MRCFIISFFLIVQCTFLQAQAGRGMAMIQVLASDSLAGRGYLDDGLEKSANYISSQLFDYGIPHTRQELTYPINTFPGKISLSTVKSGKEMILEPGIDFLIHPSSGSVNFSNKKTEQLNLEDTDYKSLKLKSKKVYLLNKTEGNSAQLNEFVSYFLETAAIKNALLIVQDSSKLNWFPSQVQSNNSVVFLKNQQIGDELTASWKADFKKEFPTSNILAKIPGRRSDSVLMYSAHYDHLGKMGDENIFYGANDNASGVAMLLLLSEHFADNIPAFDTYFLFTTGEEAGLLGSYYFIQNPMLDLSKIKLLINLDMVGTGEEGIMIVNAKKHPYVPEKMNDLNDGRIPAIKERGEACNSDHCLFDQIGVPAVFIYTLGGRKAYHDVEDRAEGLSLHAFDALHDILIELSEKL